MSRTMRSPASSHANSVASSRASRLRAMSIKTGVTMMTTDSAEVETDVFRENYFRSHNQIEQYKKIRDQIASDLRRMQVTYEFRKNQMRDRESGLDIKESLLMEREASILKDTPKELRNFQQQQRMAEQRRESKVNMVDDLKGQLDSVYKEISKALDETLKNSTIRNDIPLLKTENNGLITAIQKKHNRIMTMEEMMAKQMEDLNRLRDEETALNAEKQKYNDQYEDIENRRNEAIRVTSEPIDSTEYEEKAVADLEEDAENTEKRFEAIIKSDERDDTPKILAQIERLEQQNVKRKIIITNKRAVLENQKKFRERRVLEDEKRIQQQKESLEKLRQEIAEAEKIKEERAKQEAEDDAREEKSMHFKKITPPVKIRSETELAEQIKKFEAKNQEKLDQLVNEISQIENQYKNDRNAEREKWKRIMRRIDKYTKRLTKKEAMQLEINEMNEKNDELQERLKTLLQTKEILNRRKFLTATRHGELLEEGSSIDTINRFIKKKKNDIEEKKQELQERNRDLEDQKVRVDKLDEAVRVRTRRVQALEAEVAKYQEIMRNAVDNLNDDQMSLDSSIVTRL